MTSHERGRGREPAGAHFRRMADAPDVAACRFEIYRMDEVSRTSVLFSGGDWHWQLCNEAGRVLVEAGGYLSEQACRDAVGILQQRAVDATVAADR